MSSQPIIEILIAPDGATSVQTRGIRGPGCLDASRFLETALGQRLSQRRTAEFYEPAQQQHRREEA